MAPVGCDWRAEEWRSFAGAQDDGGCGRARMKKRRFRSGKFRLAEIGDFLVEVGEGGFEGFAMLGVGGGREVIHDARAR